MANSGVTPKSFPPQTQDVNPGQEYVMDPPPTYDTPNYKGSDKLKGKVAIITGGDSGIGRSVSIFFAREGADIVIVYLKNHKDAQDTKKLVENEGRKCMTMAGDVGDSSFCKQIVDDTMKRFGHLDVLVNNAGIQVFIPIIYSYNFFSTRQETWPKFRTKTWNECFEQIFFPCFIWPESACLIWNQDPPSSTRQGTFFYFKFIFSSVVSYKGKPEMLDYSSSKGAITAFTRSLALQLVKRGIRVNGVAPGPIWYMLICIAYNY